MDDRRRSGPGSRSSPPPPRPRSTRLRVGKHPGHAQVHFGPGTGAARDFERSANLLRPLAHAANAEMAWPTAVAKDRRVDALAVVSTQQAQLAPGEDQLDFDAVRIGGLKRIDQRFTT